MALRTEAIALKSSTRSSFLAGSPVVVPSSGTSEDRAGATNGGQVSTTRTKRAVSAS
jgi:hypothetical protein